VFLLSTLTITLESGRDGDDIALLGMDVPHGRRDLRMPCDPHQGAHVIESDLAARKLRTLPSIPKKPGGKPDLFDRLNLR